MHRKKRKYHAQFSTLNCQQSLLELFKLPWAGVHSATLTHDNQILTWGVNDEGTLGRDTKDKAKKTPIDAASDAGEDEDSEDDEVELNLKEASPLPVDPSHFPNGTVFTQLVATDSATYVLTREGLVYGWGTFRVRTFQVSKVSSFKLMKFLIGQ